MWRDLWAEGTVGCDGSKREHGGWVLRRASPVWEDLVAKGGHEGTELTLRDSVVG